MGLPITGAFARATQMSAPYAGAAKWGTGVNLIHSYYQGPPRPGGIGVPNDMDQRTPPTTANDQAVELGPPWGAPDDPSYLDAVASQQMAMGGVPFDQGDWPDWTEDTETTRDQVTPGYPSYNESGQQIRSVTGGPTDYVSSFQTPTETVSEGWENKATGAVADSEPSDNAQIFVQTSQTQRYREQNNDRALMRHSDAPRTPIKSRVKGQVKKVYSGDLRHYDMFPYQIDDIPRPFYYRTAATGPGPYNLANAWHVVSPIQRTPPPDPSQGVVDTTLTDSQATGDYGYTSEDWGY